MVKIYFESVEEAREFSKSIEIWCENFQGTCGGDCSECRITMFKKSGYIKNLELEKARERHLNSLPELHSCHP